MGLPALKAWEALLVVVGVALVPALAIGDTGLRPSSAAVANTDSAFVAVTSLGPSAASPIVLVNSNDFEAAAVRVQNNLGASILVQVSLVENPGGRFVLAWPQANLGPGAAIEFKLQDDASPHSRTCTSVVVRVVATMQGPGGAREGQATIDSRVHVQVGNRC